MALSLQDSPDERASPYAFITRTDLLLLETFDSRRSTKEDRLRLFSQLGNQRLTPWVLSFYELKTFLLGSCPSQGKGHPQTLPAARDSFNSHQLNYIDPVTSFTALEDGLSSLRDWATSDRQTIDKLEASASTTSSKKEHPVYES
ncbi:SBP (S-ribonuclease binding protein) family protein [Striga asiatica]|uniref:SBP (S-ribonuclease binding protein) family protein n=1 Tax=Striga asiatica TaxID=4170 RepID=A0A5A7QVE8_STRAF|nr:SBP (S-ribonuclease binding protein) family protein [Striga asiatica]